MLGLRGRGPPRVSSPRLRLIAPHHHARRRSAPILLVQNISLLESNFPSGVGQEQAPVWVGPLQGLGVCFRASCPCSALGALRWRGLCPPSGTCASGRAPARPAAQTPGTAAECLGADIRSTLLAFPRSNMLYERPLSVPLQITPCTDPPKPSAHPAVDGPPVQEGEMAPCLQRQGPGTSPGTYRSRYSSLLP